MGTLGVVDHVSELDKRGDFIGSPEYQEQHKPHRPYENNTTSGRADSRQVATVGTNNTQAEMQSAAVCHLW